jgi:hypothetical protein
MERKNQAFFVKSEVIYGTTISEAGRKISVSGFLHFPNQIGTKSLDESQEVVSIKAV